MSLALMPSKPVALLESRELIILETSFKLKGVKLKDVWRVAGCILDVLVLENLAASWDPIFTKKVLKWLEIDLESCTVLSLSSFTASILVDVELGRNSLTFFHRSFGLFLSSRKEFR